MEVAKQCGGKCVAATAVAAGDAARCQRQLAVSRVDSKGPYHSMTISDGKR